VTYSSLALIKAARPSRSAWRRHVPFALVLAALTCLSLAAARPQIRADIPVAGSSVILALDVSGSMCATDVEPNRLSAAQAAVRTCRGGQLSESDAYRFGSCTVLESFTGVNTNHSPGQLDASLLQKTGTTWIRSASTTGERAAASWTVAVPSWARAANASVTGRSRPAA
jgi:hypothetical protein